MEKKRNMAKAINNGKPAIDIYCTTCDKEFESDYEYGQVKKYNPEFNSWENHSVSCPSCNKITIFNLNLPDEELSDGFFNAVGMDFDERQQRLVIKKLKEDFNFEPKP